MKTATGQPSLPRPTELYADKGGDSLLFSPCPVRMPRTGFPYALETVTIICGLSNNPGPGERKRRP
jgi:hypothetical protein